EDMFAGSGSAKNPFLSQASWQRDIDGIHIFGTEQSLIGAQRLRRRWSWNVAVTFRDKAFAFFEVAARDGREDGIAAESDGLPVFTRDVGGPQNSPAQRFHAEAISGVGTETE